MIDRVIDVIFELKMNLATKLTITIRYFNVYYLVPVLLSDTVWHSEEQLEMLDTLGIMDILMTIHGKTNPAQWSRRINGW
jgi:hypothetical protein